MILHWPTIDDVLLPHPFFYTPKAKAFKIIEQISRENISGQSNIIDQLNKKLTPHIPTLEDKCITNKIR
jgi:hypothetical protein